jgi:hypothetical protein
MHPETMYELTRMRMAEDLRAAERQRLIRRAGAEKASGAIDAVRFRDRLTRLLGAVFPAGHDGATPARA